VNAERPLHRRKPAKSEAPDGLEEERRLANHIEAARAEAIDDDETIARLETQERPKPPQQENWREHDHPQTSAKTDDEFERGVLEKVVADTALVVPDALLNEEMSYRLSRFADELRRAGISIQQFIDQTGQTEEQIECDRRAQAERNVSAQLILEEVGKREELSTSDEETAAELAEHAKALGKEESELRTQLGSGGRMGALSADIIRRKALDLIVSRADIKEEAPKEGPTETQGAAS